MLYDCGAFLDRKMSDPNTILRRQLADYRYPDPKGLASPITWFEGLVGLEAPQDMVTDSANDLAALQSSVSGVQGKIQTYLQMAQGYDSASDATTRQKAAAVESEATGLNSSYLTVQSQIQLIAGLINDARNNPALSKDSARTIQNNVSALSDLIGQLLSNVKQLGNDVSALAHYAQAGPGVVQTLESTAINSVSTLTWIVGGSLAAYFLLPSFLPRLAGGLRRARKS